VLLTNMLLDTNPAHPQFVAHDTLPNGFEVKTILNADGGCFKTLVLSPGHFTETVCYRVCRNKALNAHQKMVDKYTFLHWTE